MGGSGSEFSLFIEKVDPVDLPDYRRRREGAYEESDARTLPILRKDGERQRDFKESVGLISPVSLDDWRVSGPRTTKWCLEFLAKKNGLSATTSGGNR